MTKRKLTKHEDDILRNIRQPDRYDPKARSIGGPWRMVKCKDGAYVCYEQHLEIIDNIRKNAEIDSAQSPHDGIHTCSKGCRKPGCNRTLRDTIEEQDAQIVALKQDLLQQSAAARHLRMERVHDLNHIGGLQQEIAELRSQFANSEQDYARLKAEVERLKEVIRREVDGGVDLREEAQRTVEENHKLRAEVERLRASSFVTAVPVEQYERLCKAGDDLLHEWSSGDETDGRNFKKGLVLWNAAKEGKQSV